MIRDWVMQNYGYEISEDSLLGILTRNSEGENSGFVLVDKEIPFCWRVRAGIEPQLRRNLQIRSFSPPTTVVPGPGQVHCEFCSLSFTLNEDFTAHQAEFHGQPRQEIEEGTSRELTDCFPPNLSSVDGQALGGLTRKRPWGSVEQSAYNGRRIRSSVQPQVARITPKPASIQLQDPNADDQVAVPTSEAEPNNSAIQACDADAEDVYEHTNESDTANRRPLISTRISVLVDRIEAAAAARDKAMEARDHEMQRNTRLQTRLRSRISKLATERDQAIKIHDSALKENYELQLRLRNLEACLRSLSAEKDEALRARDAAMKDSNLQTKALSYAGVDRNKPFDLFTKALVASNGVVAHALVVVDPGSIFNLIPESIVQCLGLPSHVGNMAMLTIGDHDVHTNQYCRFDIQVAGVETTINAAVVPAAERSSIQLGRLWVRMANLLSDFDHRTYYIPDPQGNLIKLPAELHEEVASQIEEQEANATPADDSMTLHDATDGSDSDVQNYLTADEVTDRMVHTQKDKSKLEGLVVETDEDQLTSYEADESSTSEIDEPDLSLSYDSSSSSQNDPEYPVERILAEKVEKGTTHYLLLWAGFPENESTWEPRKNIRDHRILDEWRERKIQEASGEQPSFNLVRFEKGVQRRRLLKGKQPQRAKKPRKRVGNSETQQYNLRQKGDSFHRKPESGSSISAKQTKEILIVLDQIRRTQAGSNFRAPVIQLWPECAEAYTAKISNHIDLAAIEKKLKKGIYPSIHDFRADICLLYQNALDFNGIDDVLTSAALEVQNTILAAINENDKITTIDARRRASARRDGTNAA